MAAIPFPLHPMLVHFPIALFTSALILEALSLVFRKESLHRAALQIYSGAAIVTPLVVLTGLGEEDRLRLHHPVLEIHESFGLATLWISLASLFILWVFKNKVRRYFRPVFFACLLLIVSSVVITAYNGGRLVYEYGVAVEK